MVTTLSDVAQLAGVSTAAVSLVLNGKKGVSNETRQKILTILDETGYRVNRLGRALRQSKTGSIGLYMPSSAVHFGYYTETTLGVAETLNQHDISLLIVPSAPQATKIEAFPAVDGFILIEPHSDDLGVDAILRQDLPVVSGDPPDPSFHEPWGIVESPNFLTTVQVFDRFLQAGARRPGLLLIDRVSTWAKQLESAYAEWCEEHAIEPRILLVDIHESNDALTTILRPWADSERGCDAILAGGDGIAVRIAGTLRTLGHRVGESIKLISGVDSPMMEFHTPRITAIDLQPREFGSACAELLIELLDQPRPAAPVRRQVDAPLIARESG
ncbi:MAG: LacI family transcriptional regulator [Microbacteriaceae bacterium]|nr:MAG: LacI family transcriptional regulator [Microbacteriaceae bacterium]